MNEIDEPARDAVRKRLKRYAAILSGRLTAETLKGSDVKEFDQELREEAFDQLRRRCRLRELAPLALFEGLGDVAVPLSMVDEETGHGNHVEMTYVAAAARLRQPRRIFEFGTFLGRTTRHLAAMNPDAQVWTLDLPREQNPWRFADHVGSYFAGTPEAARINFLRCDARTFDTTPYRRSMDFIWVDGDHGYDAVKNDTEKAFEMLAPGGAILWHDFAPDSLELVRYFTEFTATQPLFRLRRTSILVHLDGVDPLTFTPYPVPFSKAAFRKTPADTADAEPDPGDDDEAIETTP